MSSIRTPPHRGNTPPGPPAPNPPPRKPVFRPWGQGGALVDVQPHSVARGMNKILQISRTIQRFPHPGIHVPAPDPRTDGPDSSFLGAPYGIEHPAQRGRGAQGEDGNGLIGTVTPSAGAEIDDD